jgi:hypothetical protein
MFHARAIAVAASVAALGLTSSAAADPTPSPAAGGAEVFNYGQCVSQGFPSPSDREFGPLILLFNPNGLVVNVPPGLQQGPAANPLGQIGCPVVGGAPGTP